MTTYTVIWRGLGDEFMFTEVEREDAENCSSLEWVVLAADVEFADYDPIELIQIKADLLIEGYDLLEVVEGILHYAG
jgi:hypothetical protein